MSAIDDAARLMRQRLSELEQERKELRTALRALEGGSSARRRNGSGKRSSAGTGRRGRRAPRGQRQEQFLAQITARPGARMSEIAKAMGVRPQQLYPIARRLTGDGTVVKSGNGYALGSGSSASAAAA